MVDSQSDPGQSTTQPQPTQAEGGNDVKFKTSNTLATLQRMGFRILILGMTPESFMEKVSLKKITIFIILFMFYTVFASYEVIVAFVFSRNLLEKVSHAYISTYLFAFNFQWLYIVINVKTLYASDCDLETFICARKHPEVSQILFDNKARNFFRALFLSCLWWSLNSMTHIIGPGCDALITYIQEGSVEGDVFVLPSVFAFPWWGQIVMYIYNAITMFGLLLYCISSYSIMGARVTKLTTVCSILNDAMKHDQDDGHDIKDYIKDHVNIIKYAQTLNHQLSVLNSCMFTACYLEFATQMFALTLFEPKGSYYFAVAFDLLSIFFILSFQCWMGSIITHSLHSIATGVYETKWYAMKKNNALDVLLMTQMAQRTYIQRIWFNTVTVDRQTILNLVKSSYAAYTVLMMLQKK